jgi:SAM-dependent methyltransferase
LTQQSHTVLSCSNAACQRHWEIKNGIPDFLPEDLPETLAMTEDSAVDSPIDHAHTAELETDFHKNFKKKSVLRDLYVDYAFGIRQEILANYAQALGRKLDILDIGSGALLSGKAEQGGRHFNILKTYSRSYKAIEPSWSMIDQVNVPDSNLYHLSAALLVRGVGESLPFPPQSCDVVFFLSMLDHVINPEQVLREAQSVLRPGGIVVISLQNYQSWQRRLARSVLSRYMHQREEQDHHNWRFTPATILQLLNDTHYVNANCTELNYLTFPRLQPLENFWFTLPQRLLGKTASLNLIRWIDRHLAQWFPGCGGTFVVYAYRKPAP